MTAIFSCRPNSHPFQERRVSLTEPAKIGRSVARARLAANNAIFDCKVLSRNHALLWFQDGKFFLKDTKSSNGTFVNNQRLSKGAEESLPFQINSGDVVQFGVDVVENSRRVTHGCIVSQVRLYLPTGEEANEIHLSTHLLDKVSHNPVYPTIQSQDLYQLHQYIQEALHREQMLEQKLALLQRLVADSHETSEKGWQALIDEDKLLSRLEFLENQLQSYAKTLSEETTQKELLQLQEEKHNYETTSKETLKQVLDEKLEAQQRLGNMERSYSNAEDECTHLREVLSKTQEEMKELVEKHQTFTDKAQDVEMTRLEEKKCSEQKNEEHEKRIEILEETEKDLHSRLESIVLEVEVYQTQIEDLKNQMETFESPPEATESKKDQMETFESAPETTESKKALPQLETINGSANLKDKLNDILENQETIKLADIEDSLKEDNIEVVKTIELCENPFEETMNILSNPLGEYDNLQLSTAANENQHEAVEKVDDEIHLTKLKGRIAQLECLLAEYQSSQKAEETRRKDVETQLDLIQKERESERETLTETTRALQAALSERELLLEKEDKLRSRIEESESLLKSCETDSISSSSETEEIGQGEEDDDLTCGSLIIAKAKLKELKKKLRDKESELADVQSEKSESSSENLEDMVKSSLLDTELLSLRSSAEESLKLRVELEEARLLARQQRKLYEEAQQRFILESESNLSLKEMKEQLQTEKSENDARIKELEDLLSSSNKQQKNYESVAKEKSELEGSLKNCKEVINNLKHFEEDLVKLTKKNEKQAGSAEYKSFSDKRRCLLLIMAEADARVIPHVSCRTSTQPQSRIPMLSQRAPDVEEPKIVSPRCSKLPIPKTTSRSIIRKSASQMSPPGNPTVSTRTNSSVSETAIPKKGARSLIKPPSSARAMRLSSKTSHARMKARESGEQNPIPKTTFATQNLAARNVTEKTIPTQNFAARNVTEKTIPTQNFAARNVTEKTIPTYNFAASKVSEKTLEDISDAIFERVYGSEYQVVLLTDVKAPPDFSDSDSSDTFLEKPQTKEITKVQPVKSSIKDNSNMPMQDECEKISPIVPPLDLNLLDDYAAALVHDALKGEGQVLKEEEVVRQKEEVLRQEQVVRQEGEVVKEKEKVVRQNEEVVRQEEEVVRQEEVVTQEEVVRQGEEAVRDEEEVVREEENNHGEISEKMEDEDIKWLVEEKRLLLDDMQSLNKKLEQQQTIRLRESDSDKEQLEKKLKVKQEEVNSVNRKFADLLNEQKKLLGKVSEQDTKTVGIGNAFLAAVFAVLIGFAYFFWQNR